jgi:ELP3 family radical SAM enzyme/protein acetyltransferase
MNSELYNKNYNLYFSKIKPLFNRMFYKTMSKYKLRVKKPVLMFYYKKYIEEGKIKDNNILKKLLMKSPSRDISGINQITILTSPHPDNQSFSCKHDCFYCPNEPAHEDNNFVPQPRSYLSKEPAVQRANRNEFDAYKQTHDRLCSLFSCGHKCDKLEFIIEGGTFTEYPKQYLIRFFRDFIYCCNVYFESIDKTKELREKKSLEEEIFINKTSKCRIIGICIETRPDSVMENDEDGEPWLKTLLSWGVTRIQLGMQHIDNKILKKINRGHTVETAIKAIEFCKDNCFKIDVHIMPDLPNSTPEKDMEMFDYIYESPDIQPDQMKIYPCEVVPWTKIEKWYKEGNFKPYGEDRNKMDIVLKYAMTHCPPYIRLPRVIRDIPHSYISGGVKCGNLRQIVNDQINNENSYSMDIRFREIGRHPEYNIDDARLFIREYEASNGKEFFISFETYDNKAIYGFVRLRIPHKYREIGIKDIYNFQYEILTHEKPFYDETLKDMGLIRELHVYGGVQKVNSRGETIQHKGLGKKLLNKAEEIAIENNLKGLVVIWNWS